MTKKQVTKRPPVKETVGAQYVCFSSSEDVNEYNGKYEDIVEKTETVKKVSVSENGDSTPVPASGKTYMTVTSTSSTEISVEVVAFPSETISRMRGDTVTESGLILSGGNKERPRFAYGKTVIMHGGLRRFDWYPNCQLSANTDDIETSDTSFKEQNDTLTISAMPFNDNGDIVVRIKEDFKAPQGLTEDIFFSQPILSEDDLKKMLVSNEETTSGGETSAEGDAQ